MQQIFKEWGDIDIIINNAGISCFSPITETGVEDFDRILSVNLRPVFITSRRLAIHRQSQEAPNPFGRIVNICSTRYLMSEPGSEGYAASKGGIYSLTHALAQTGDVFRFTYSPRRMLGVIFWAKLFVVARLDPARRNRVDRDMPLGKR